MSTIKISAVFAGGNFEVEGDAARYANVFRAVAAAEYPGAEIDVDVRESQAGGGFIRVEIDGDEDDGAADYLRQTTDRKF